VLKPANPAAGPAASVLGSQQNLRAPVLRNLAIRNAPARGAQKGPNYQTSQSAPEARPAAAARDFRSKPLGGQQSRCSTPSGGDVGTVAVARCERGRAADRGHPRPVSATEGRLQGPPSRVAPRLRGGSVARPPLQPETRDPAAFSVPGTPFERVQAVCGLPTSITQFRRENTHPQRARTMRRAGRPAS